MTRGQGGLLPGVGLAAGIAIGAAGSAFAASPAPTTTTSPAAITSAAPSWSQMMGNSGAGMMNLSPSSSAAPSPTFGPATMGGSASSTGAPSATFGSGMMVGLDPSQRAALYEACDAMHDAIHGAGPDEAAPTSTPAS